MVTDLTLTPSPAWTARLTTALALVCIGCTAPATLESQVPSDTPAASASASPSPTALPTPSASSEPSATPAPTLAFEAPDGILPPDSTVVVVVDELQLRAGPGLAEDVTGVAVAGDQFSVPWWGFGPVVSDGLDWYRVRPATVGDLDAWAAAASGTDHYFEVVAPSCPSGEPDLETLLNMGGAWNRLACFGDRSITLEGSYGCGGCGGMAHGVYAPMWLAYPITGHLLHLPDQAGVLEMRVAPDSGVEIPAEASIVRVTGHFSDPASTSCRIATGDPFAVDARVAELYCREQFVVDSFEVFGIDPDFPSS